MYAAAALAGRATRACRQAPRRMAAFGGRADHEAARRAGAIVQAGSRPARAARTQGDGKRTVTGSKSSPPATLAPQEQ